MSAPEAPFEIIIKPKSVFNLGWKELWQYRELLYFFTWKEIKVRYKQAALGILWTLLQPLAMMTIFVLLLAQGMGLKTGKIPAPVYYLCGLLIWNLFNHGVTHASQSMVSNANIIKKIYFPRLVIPLSAVLTSSFDFMISLVLFYGLLLYYSIINSFSVAWLHLGISILIAYIIVIFTAFSLVRFYLRSMSNIAMFGMYCPSDSNFVFYYTCDVRYFDHKTTMDQNYLSSIRSILLLIS